jgi:hypothetical protein
MHDGIYLFIYSFIYLFIHLFISLLLAASSSSSFLFVADARIRSLATVRDVPSLHQTLHLSEHCDARGRRAALPHQSQARPAPTRIK